MWKWKWWEQSQLKLKLIKHRWENVKFLIKIKIFQFITLSVLLATACASPIHAGDYQQSHYSTTPIPILKFDQQQNHDGSYQYGYETGNGIQVQEQGYVKNKGVKDGEIQVAQGSYSYIGPDGKPIFDIFGSH